MSFQSLVHREGWKSQTLAFLASAQVLCRSCLSRRFPTATLRRTRITDPIPRTAAPARHYHHRPITGYTFSEPHRRTIFLRSAAAYEAVLPEPVRTFRQQLYQSLPEPLRKNRTQPLNRRVQLAIARRLQRNRVLELFYKLDKDPELLKYLTTQDLRALVALLTPPPGLLSHPPDSSITNQTNDPHGCDENVNVHSIINGLIRKRPEMFTEEDISWLVPILVNYGDLDNAVKILQEHLDAGHTPSEATFTALVAGLARAGQTETATAWLDQMKKYGYTETNSSIVCAMVDGCMSCGKVDKAEEITRRHWDENLGEGLARCGHEAAENGQLHAARRFYRHRAALGMKSKPLLSHICNKGLYTLQKNTIRKLLKDAIQLEDWEGCSLVTMKLLQFYVQRGNLASAIKLWSATRSYPNVFGEHQYTILVRSLSKTGYHEPLMRLYRTIKKRYPDVLTVDVYNECLRTFVHAKAYKYALSVFSDMKARIPVSDMTKHTFYAMYALCAQTGKVGLFQELLRMAARAEMEMDFKTTSSMMACYLKANDVPAAMKVFENIATTHGPDTIDYNLLIRATAQNEGDGVDLGKLLKILQHMNKMGITPNQSTFRTLLGIYDQGEIENRLIEQLLTDRKATVADEIFLNNIALTREIVRHSPLEAVRKFLQNDRRNLFKYPVGKGPILADGMTYKLLMDGLSKSPQHVYVTDKLYQNMQSKGWKPYREIYEVLISGWARKGRIQRARRIIKDMERDLDIKPDIRIYTMLVDGLLLNNKHDQALSMISELREIGLEPDNILLQRIEQFKQSDHSNASSSSSSSSSSSNSADNKSD